MKMMLAVAAVPLSVARPYVKNWNKNGIGVQALRRTMKPGSKGYRLYIPIKPGKRPKVQVPKEIQQVLAQLKYKVEDYITGIAVDFDGKRRMKIGKLLKDEKLRNEFANDPQRSAFRNDYTCVISCHPYDVLSMSTGRRWDQTSCMRLKLPGDKNRPGAYHGTVKHDVAEGTLVAYAISPKDENINSPHARLLIKPFYSKDGKNILFQVETTIYGTPIPGFRETVERWLKKVNKNAAAGSYRLHGSLYDDGLGTEKVHAEFAKLTPEQRKKLWEDLDYDERAIAISEDIRWLPIGIKYSYESGINMDDDDLGNKIGGFLWRSAYTNDFSTAAVAKATAEGIHDAQVRPGVVGEMARHLLGQGAYKAVKACMPLKEAANRKFAYNPDQEIEPEDAEVYAGWDSRWLANLRTIRRLGVKSIFTKLMRGEVVDTPEFKSSDKPGSKALRRALGVLVGIVAEADPATLNRWQTTVPKVARQFKQKDRTYDDVTYTLIGVSSLSAFNRIFKAHAPNMFALLCAYDPSWAKEDEDIAERADQGVLDLEKAFRNLASLDDKNINGILINAIYQNRGSTDWFVNRKYCLDFVKQLAATVPESENDFVVHRAQRIMEKYNANVKELDDIFDQLGDLDLGE